MTMVKKAAAAEAEYYNETRDLSGFDEENPVNVTSTRSVTISVRFSEEEITQVRSQAEEAGLKVTSFIRAASLEATSPVDRAELVELARDLERRAHQVAAVVDRGA
ncbi:plasmid mobilization protein [Pseudactinotalea sp. Z1732]